MSNLHTQRLTALFLAASLMAVQVPAQARAGSPAPAPAPKAAAAPKAAPTPAPATKPAVAKSGESGQRAGAGGNVGMQRPDVVARVRADEAAKAATPLAAAPAAALAATPSRGLFGGSPGAVSGNNSVTMSREDYERQRRNDMLKAGAAGAVVGGVVGYAAGHQNSTAQVLQPQQQPGYQGSPDYATRDAIVRDGPMASDSPMAAVSGARIFGWALFLALAGAIGFILYRRTVGSRGSVFAGTLHRSRAEGYPGVRRSAPSDESQLHAMAPGFFTDIQDLNNDGALDALRQRATAEVFAVFEADILQRSEPSLTRVLTLSARVVDMTREGDRTVASVDYDAMISEGPNQSAERVREVWHFVREYDGAWKLAGIEQV